MAGDSNKSSAANPQPAPGMQPLTTPQTSGTGPAADSAPPTGQVGQLDQTQSSDFQPRQARAAAKAPATTVPAAGSGMGAGSVTGGPLPEESQVVRGRSKPGEQGKELDPADVGRFTFPITIHAPGPDHVPYKFEGEKGMVSDGHFQAHEYPPGAVVRMSLAEGRKLVARHGGTELKPDENPPGQPPVTVNDRGPEGPEADKAAQAKREAAEGAAQYESHQANG